MPIKTRIATSFSDDGAACDWKFTELRAVVTAKDSGILITKDVTTLTLHDGTTVTVRDITLLPVTSAGLRQLADDLDQAIAADVGPTG